MPDFRVTVVRELTQYADFTVRAESEDSASEIADDRLADMGHRRRLDWESGTAHDYDVLSVMAEDGEEKEGGNS